MTAPSSHVIRPAQGRLGVLTPGMGAVATTFMAGVESVRRGLALPIGSTTQLGTIRLGKRTENRSPAIKDFVPLAGLDDLVFGGWDPIPDDAYTAATKAGVLEEKHVERIADFLKALKPMPAVFDQYYVKKLHGTNVKQGKTKRELAEQLREDIRNFKAANRLDRLVMVWCASTEIFIQASPVHASLKAFERAMDENHPDIGRSGFYFHKR